MIRISQMAIVLVATFGCSDANAGARSEANQEGSALREPRSFSDVRDYISSPEQIEAWYGLTAVLRQNFDDVCGDTFCEGDYSNYESLGFRCSVNRAGSLGGCVWIFAASIDEVVPRTGQFRTQPRSWQCTMPIARGTQLNDVLDKLSAAGPQPIFAPLPGTSQSLYDGLLECL